jgi:hypothetical protein
MTLHDRLIEDPLSIADELDEETNHIYSFYVTVSHLYHDVHRGERDLETVVTTSKVEELVERKVDAEREKLALIGNCLRYNGYFLWERVYMRPAVRLAGRTEKQCRRLMPELDRIVHQCRQRVLDMDGESIVESLVEAVERAEEAGGPREPDRPGSGNG